MTTRRARIAVPADPAAVAFARDRVIAQVRGWGVPLDGETSEAVKLVASELITNAVVHSAGLPVAGLYYDQEAGRLLLVVHDSNPELPHRIDATADDVGGRGLALVAALATEHGWEPTDRGKKVWAAFDVAVPSRPTLAAPLRRRLQAVTPWAHMPGGRPLARAADM
ncbi:ATP-binding protein [Streptomyces sp. NPDC006692]|uniref:ATP-binding protein n=1 Tax=Streptomyces sp. NPDC006692 TaxID=3364758 RepID=UPI0036B055C4